MKRCLEKIRNDTDMYERNNIIEQMKKNELFSNLSNEQISNIISKVKYTVKTYDKDEIIAVEDEECDSLGLVLNGIVEIQRIYASGKYIVLKRMASGEVFGEAIIFSKINNYPATIIAMSKASVAFIKKEEILKLFVIDDIILKNFISLLSDKIFVLNNKIKNISFKTVKQKVVNYILDQMNQQKSDKIVLKSSKEQISSYIGIPRPSLSRELMKLRDEGIIDFDKNTITVCDVEALEEELID